MTAVAQRSSILVAWLGLALGNLCWAGNALIARAFADSIAPFTLAFWRWCLALLVLLPFIALPLWRHRATLRHAGWRLLVVSALGICGYNSFLYSAAHSTVALNITLVNTCLPLAAYIGAGLLLGEWPAARAWLGMLVASVGLLLLLARGSWAALVGMSFNPGDLLMLVAVVDWALYTLLLRRWAGYFTEVPGIVLLGAMILCGVPMLLPLYLIELAGGSRLELTPGNLAAIGYTVLFASLLAYFLWNRGVAVLGAARASMSNYLMPLFTAVLGWLLLGEGLQPYHWVGGALIFAGLLLPNCLGSRSS